MQVPIQFKYQESIIPKRCRKPRLVEFDGEYTVEIREITANDAPVAIIEHDRYFLSKNKNGITVEYRLYGDKLYVNQKLTHHDRFSSNPCWKFRTLDTNGFRPDYRNGTFVKMKSEIKKWASEYLIIDGEVWIEHGEPRYCVMTYGLGCNHGGTGLSIFYSYNGNISHKAYYPITKRAEAIASAEATALGRGDNESVPMIIHNDFEILIPEAIKVDPDAQHGDDDPFMNKVEGLVSGLQNPAMAVVALMAEVCSNIPNNSCRISDKSPLEILIDAGMKP